MEELPGQTEIRRENLQRMVAVTARLEGVDLGAGIAAVQNAVAETATAAGIRVEYGGAYEEQQKSFHDLVLVLVLAMVLVFTVLLFEFGTFARADRDSCRRRCCRPRACFWRCWSPSTTFNMSSFMGLIMVIGIVAKNGILLLDADAASSAREGAAPHETR